MTKTFFQVVLNEVLKIKVEIQCEIGPWCPSTFELPSHCSLINRHPPGGTGPNFQIPDKCIDTTRV